MSDMDLMRHLVTLTLATVVSLPVWVPLVFLAYAIGRKTYSLRLLFVLVTVEAICIGFVLWALNVGP